MWFVMNAEHFKKLRQLVSELDINAVDAPKEADAYGCSKTVIGDFQLHINIEYNGTQALVSIPDGLIIKSDRPE